MTEPAHPEPAQHAVSWLFGGGGLVAIGYGLRWLWEKITGLRETREAKLAKREAELEKRVNDRLGHLETEIAGLKDEQEKSRVVIGILVAKVARDDPEAPELKQVERILGAAFPIAFGLPAEMREQLAQINAATRAPRRRKPA